MYTSGLQIAIVSACLSEHATLVQQTYLFLFEVVKSNSTSKNGTEIFDRVLQCFLLKSITLYQKIIIKIDLLVC